MAADAIHLENGVRSTFYGGRYTGALEGGDIYGWSMAFGDIDGDGYTDFVGSAENAEGPDDVNDHQSDVYVFFGRPEAQADSLYAVDDPGVADIVIYRGGWAMACGDIDNDGYDDLILAELLAQTGAYIIFGGPRSQLRSVYNFDPGSTQYTVPDVHITGSPRLGGTWLPTFAGGPEFVSLAVATGDINNDGFAEIVLGDLAYKGPSGQRNAGAVHVILGCHRAAMPPVISVDATAPLPHPDVSIYGSDLGDTYPIHIAIGDFDGDGIDDLVTCTYNSSGEDNTGPFSGEVIGFWGRAVWNSVYDLQVEDFDFAISGSTADRFAYRMSTGDLDGDGRDDLIVGSPFIILDDINRLNMGEYRVYFGRPRSLWPKWANAVSVTDVLMIGANTGEAYSVNGPLLWAVPMSMATGNRNADRYADLLIGAGHGYGPGSGRPGRSYVLLGRPRGEWPVFIDLLDGYDTVYYGVDDIGSPGYQFDLLGSTVGMADWDGDAVDELFLAAQFADGPDNAGQDNGEVYIVFSTDSLATPVPPIDRVATSALLPNYPNPFNPATTLHYQAPVGVPVSLTVYDALGRKVARPFETRANAKGSGHVQWDGRDDRGTPLPSGVYFVKLRAGNEAHARKVHLVR